MDLHDELMLRVCVYTFLLIDLLLDNIEANALWFIGLIDFETLWKFWPFEKCDCELLQQAVHWCDIL